MKQLQRVVLSAFGGGAFACCVLVVFTNVGLDLYSRRIETYRYDEWSKQLIKTDVAPEPQLSVSQISDAKFVCPMMAQFAGIRYWELPSVIESGEAFSSDSILRLYRYDWQEKSLFGKLRFAFLGLADGEGKAVSDRLLENDKRIGSTNIGSARNRFRSALTNCGVVERWGRLPKRPS